MSMRGGVTARGVTVSATLGQRGTGSNASHSIHEKD